MSTSQHVNTKTTVASNDGAATTNEQERTKNSSLAVEWTRLVHHLGALLTRGLKILARLAATNPKCTILATVIFSLSVIVLGLATNFYLEVDDTVLWTPQDSRPINHMKWIEDQSGFPARKRNFFLQVHRDGDNVVTEEGLSRLFQAFDEVIGTPGYSEICATSDYVNDQGVTTCLVEGATKLWNHSSTIFHEAVTSDAEAAAALSVDRYPDGEGVDLTQFTGFPQYDEDGTITFSYLYFTIIRFPDNDATEEFEADVLDRMLALRDSWKDEEGNTYRVEFEATRTFADEFERSIVKDIPLVPMVFTIMSLFTCYIFYRNDRVKSRTLLGFGAVCCVFFAIMTGYGLMFTIGVSFTSMTQILPFIMFGIGLDDAFIIWGEYERTDPNKDVVERVEDTIDEVGLSVALTTITSVLAFSLGSVSTIPAVSWICYYAFTTILIDFFYQVTFFIALIVVDEKRVQERRRDCLVCVSVGPTNDDDEAENAELQQVQVVTASESSEETLVDKVMTWYADQIVHPVVRLVVLAVFAAVTVGCSISASKLVQEFNFIELMPSGSYAADFYNTNQDYYMGNSAGAMVYFRNVDQSNPEIQQQMKAYLEDMVTIDAVAEYPLFFWLDDFQDFVSDTEAVQTLTFEEQVAAFLADPESGKVYERDIVLDENGKITASRCSFDMNNIDITIVKDQLDAMEQQRAVSARQPVNDGLSDWSFFSFGDVYNIWEFFLVTVDELTFTTIMGVVAVTVVAILLIPHWTAGVFVCPLISMLYVNLLGFMQFAGLHINAVTYVALVMSIGLLVDFVAHVLLRYYESTCSTRVEKVKDTLRTMGASILIGGISTFLGVIPLAFSTSEIFVSIFYSFMGLVVMGISHGLILLPVVLSMIGPEDTIASATVEADETAAVAAATAKKLEVSKLDVVDDDFNTPSEVSL